MKRFKQYVLVVFWHREMGQQILLPTLKQLYKPRSKIDIAHWSQWIQLHVQEKCCIPAPKYCHRENFELLLRETWIRTAYRLLFRLRLGVKYAGVSGSGPRKMFRLWQLQLRFRIAGAKRLEWR